MANTGLEIQIFRKTQQFVEILQQGNPLPMPIFQSEAFILMTGMVEEGRYHHFTIPLELHYNKQKKVSNTLKEHIKQ